MASATSSLSRVNGTLQRAIEAILTDRPVAYHAVLARAVGSATAGIFLSQMLYWTPRGHDEEGWIWKTQEQIYQETALTRREQETARRVLKEAAILEEKRAGTPARLYFRVAMAQLTTLLTTHSPDDTPPQDGEEAEEMAEDEENRPPPAWRFPPCKDGGKRQSRMALSRRQEWRFPADY